MSKDECGSCSWLDVAKNATLAVANAVAHAASEGELILEKEQIQSRLDVCQTCPFLNGKRCRSCGCFVELKAALGSEDCPKGKWK